MDRRNGRKKRRGHKKNKRSNPQDKENVNTPRLPASVVGESSTSSDPSMALVPVAAATSAETDADISFKLEDWYLYINEFFKRKRSGSTLSANNLRHVDITDENYWKNLSKKDRKAWAIGLAQNRELHDRIEALEGENIRLKDLLGEVKYLVEVISDFLDEDGEDVLDHILNEDEDEDGEDDEDGGEE